MFFRVYIQEDSLATGAGRVKSKLWCSIFPVPERFINAKNVRKPVEILICLTDTVGLVIWYHVIL